MAIGAVCLLALLHTVLFWAHIFSLYRYQALYDEVTNNGATVAMTPDFLQTYRLAEERSFFSRPDNLLKDIGQIQSAMHTMVYQYKNDIYRLRDSIVQNIRFLTVASELSEELVYPEQDMTREHARILQESLNTVPAGSVWALTVLSKESTQIVERVQGNINLAKRHLLLQDIAAYKHEMILIQDMYRLNPQKEKTLDIKAFREEFHILFTRSTLLQWSLEEVTQSLTNLQKMSEKYQAVARDIRTKNRERRQDWVATELKYWTDKDKLPPVSPLPDVYEVIYISLAQQAMYVYEDNELILSTSITSGRNNFETIRGKFRVYTKQRGRLIKSPFPDIEYELWVDYWLGFSGAYGIHDACNSQDCWRTKFGGSGYVYNGSHGCINTPYNSVKFIYNWAKIGTTVYVR